MLFNETNNKRMLNGIFQAKEREERERERETANNQCLLHVHQGRFLLMKIYGFRRLQQKKTSNKLLKIITT